MRLKYYQVKCPKCGWIQQYECRKGSPVYARVICNKCERPYTVHKHITKGTQIIKRLR